MVSQAFSVVFSPTNEATYKEGYLEVEKYSKYSQNDKVTLTEASVIIITHYDVGFCYLWTERGFGGIR